jgi:hypothetical protein
LEVIQLLRRTNKVAHSIAIAVIERSDMEFVENGVFIPEGLRLHRLGSPYLGHDFAILCCQSMIEAFRYSVCFSFSREMSNFYAAKNSRALNTYALLLGHSVLLLGHC